MTHPFAKMFEKALKKSTLEENLVLREAQKICAKGYAPNEVLEVLKNLAQSHINIDDESIFRDAIEKLTEEI